MYKGFLRSLVLALGLIFSSCVSFCFAQESITITTYYPSPYGVYNELQTNKFAVGDTDGDGGLDAGDQPNNNGDIRLKAHTRAPPAESGVVGEVAYGSDDYLYVHNGSSWVKQGGLPSGAVMFFNLASCPSGWTALTGAQGRYLVGLPSGGGHAGRDRRDGFVQSRK